MKKALQRHPWWGMPSGTEGDKEQETGPKEGTSASTPGDGGNTEKRAIERWVVEKTSKASQEA